MKLFLWPVASLSLAESLAEQLKVRDFSPDGIFLTHLHLDHVGSLLDFPDIPVVTSRAGYEAFLRRPGWRSGSDVNLFRSVLEKNGRWLEDLPQCPVADGYSGADLFGDGSALAVPLAGHAWGQYGLWLDGEPPTFLVADACGLTKMLEEPVGPRIPRFFCSDWETAKLTLERLRHLKAARPEIRFLPSHCPVPFRNDRLAR
jgi:glyoxylase-like metal-dependent hydrolase (beta-lactamase superfamily II)